MAKKKKKRADAVLSGLTLFEYNGVRVEADMTNPAFFRRYLQCAESIGMGAVEEGNPLAHSTAVARMYRDFFNALFGEEAGDRMLPGDSMLDALACFGAFEAFAMRQAEHVKAYSERMRARGPVDREKLAKIKEALRNM